MTVKTHYMNSRCNTILRRILKLDLWVRRAQCFKLGVGYVDVLVNQGLGIRVVVGAVRLG